jgi:hypothetical protein
MIHLQKIHSIRGRDYIGKFLLEDLIQIAIHNVFRIDQVVAFDHHQTYINGEKSTLYLLQVHA